MIEDIKIKLDQIDFDYINLYIIIGYKTNKKWQKKIQK